MDNTDADGTVWDDSITGGSPSGSNPNSLTNLIGTLGTTAGQVISANRTQHQRAQQSSSTTLILAALAVGFVVVLLIGLRGSK